ncbi:hypothetical protein Hte_003403 [Hypoxylon texense]
MDELAGLYLGYKEPCFPEGYATLFDNNSKFDHATPPPPEKVTMAYPGTACLSDWTTACTSLVTYGTESYPQAWCCPSGSWQCATDSGRWCASVMTESTTIWMTWDPAFTDQSGNEWYTWTAEIGSAPSDSAPTVYRHVFPLSLTTGGGGGGMTSGNDSSPHNESPPENVSPPDTSSYCNDPDDRCPDGSESGFALNTGVKAGIGVAAGAVVLGISMGLLFIIRRRQKGRNGTAEATILGDNSPPAPTEPDLGDKPELEGSTVAEARGVVPKAELDAGDGERSGPGQNESRVGSGSQAGTVSPLGTLSPEPTGSDGIFPSPESRHKSVFEMPA